MANVYLSGEEPTHYINKVLSDGWKAKKLTPSEKTTDAEFLRRGTLDIIGRIATVEEVQTFEQDTNPNKRADLIDKLLESKEYSRNWATIWTKWLMAPSSPPTYQVKEFRFAGEGEIRWLTFRSDHPIYHEQMRIWLEEQFAKNVSHKELVEKLLTATGKSNENGAVHFILAHLGEQIRDKPDEWRFEMVPITSRTIRLFLGYRLEGLPYRDHSLCGGWNLHHFWGVNAFFRQVVAPRGAPTPYQGRGVDSLVLELADNPSLNPDGMVFYENQKGLYQVIRATFLDGTKMSTAKNLSRREVLSRFITKDANFSKAFANRMWGQFFGRGLHEEPAVDDFGDHNEIIHPELLDRLARDFAGRGGYDPKKLIRWICNSDAYHLKSVANPTNETPEAERYFSRMPLKLLPPEQWFESILTAAQPNAAQSLETKKNLRQKWLEKLLDKQGGQEEGEWFNTVGQVLWLMNSEELHAALAGSATLTKAMAKKDPALILDELYLAALNRHPTLEERGLIQQEIEEVIKSTNKDLAPLWQDLFWALLNSNEFIFNH